jgi:hypothetical protein
MKTKTKLSVFLIITTVIFLVACTGNGPGKFKTNTYYVFPSGNDTNPGTMEQPWMSVDKVNSIDLNPGDTVYFQGNQTFSGTLKLDSLDLGEEDLNIVITSYGKGKARIDGGQNPSLHSDGCHFLSVEQLEMRGNGRKEGNTSDGIFITNGRSVNIDQVEVYGFQHSGLHLHRCIDLKVTNVYAHDNGFAGIHVTGTTAGDPVNYDNENIYIGYCVAENNPGDPTVLRGHSGNGILASSVDGGVIEYCESFNNGWDMPWDGNGPVGIWIWDCTNFMIQYCISHDNKTHPGARDGGGFDFDGGVSNSVLQYCFSFNNQGTGIGLYEYGGAKTWENNIVRYNISQNDGQTHDGSLGIWKGERGMMRNCEIYNNTFYNSNPHGNAIWLFNSHPGFNFRNNIFIYNGRFLYEGHHFEHEVFQGNVYWNLSGGFELDGYKSIEQWAKTTGNEMVEGSVAGIFADPLLKAPGTVTVTDPIKISAETLSGYQLQQGSPLIDKGLDLKELFGIDPGETDILGTTIPRGEGFDVGAVEYLEE